MQLTPRISDGSVVGTSDTLCACVGFGWGINEAVSPLIRSEPMDSEAWVIVVDALIQRALV